MTQPPRVRVLLVDDDPTFLEALRTMFTFDERLEIVGEARDGEAAVRLAGELEPDVVAMDIVMPGVDGIEATKAIRASRPETRVVLVSGSIFQDLAEQGSDVALEAGASGYVPKARAVVELADTVVSAAGFSDPRGLVPAD
jgi:DNA-binding NarL/FixJ family response regulator